MPDPIFKTRLPKSNFPPCIVKHATLLKVAKQDFQRYLSNNINIDPNSICLRQLPVLSSISIYPSVGKPVASGHVETGSTDVTAPEIESWGYCSIAVVQSTGSVSWFAFIVVKIKITVPFNS